MDEKEIKMYVDRIRQLDQMISGLKLGSPEYNAAVREKDINQRLLSEARKINQAGYDSDEKIRVEEEKQKRQHELEVEKLRIENDRIELEKEKLRIENEKIELEKKKLEQSKADAEADRAMKEDQFEKEQKATKKRHLIDKLIVILSAGISGGIAFGINKSNQNHDIRSLDPEKGFVPRKGIHNWDIKPGDANKWGFWK